MEEGRQGHFSRARSREKRTSERRKKEGRSVLAARATNRWDLSTKEEDREIQLGESRKK